MMRTGTCVLLLVLGACRLGAAEPPLPALPVQSPSSADDVPYGFNYVGTYKLVKRVKVRSGKPFSVAIPALSYLVYTDGITLRFYGESGEGDHTSFDIYRSDGVTRMRSGNLLESVPGVQARSSVGQVLRQVTLTGATMTLTKFPALSDAVEITYAARVPETDHLAASKQTMNP